MNIRIFRPATGPVWLKTVIDSVEQHLRRLSGASVSSVVASAVTADYTVEDVGFVPVDASGGAIVITLPGVTARRITIKKIDASVNTVTISGSENIDGAATKVLSAQYAAVTLFGGTQWWIE